MFFCFFLFTRSNVVFFIFFFLFFSFCDSILYFFIYFGRYLVPSVVGVGFGFIYRGITNDLTGIQNIAGSFFALQVFWCLVGTTALDLWNAHRQLAHRQLASGYYSVGPYFCSQVMTDVLMLRILPPVAFSLPFVLLTGKCNTLEEFATFSCILILTSTSFSSICMFIGAFAKSPRTANAFGVLVMIFSLIFGGLLVNRAVAILNSTWYESLYYFAPLSYSYEAMMVQVLQAAAIDFNPQGFNTNVKTDGSVWLANFGLNADNFTFDLVALGCFTMGSLLLTLPTIAVSHGRFLQCCSFLKNQNKKKEDQDRSLINGKQKPRTRLSSNNIAHPLLNGTPSEFFMSSVAENEESGGEQNGNGGNGGNGEFKESASDGTDVFVELRQHHVVTFTDVKCILPNGRCILNQVSGEIDTAVGGVYAIMGPSGAGKTSLLDIIAGRKNTGRYEGHVMVDGVEFTSINTRKNIFGYVMQEETLIPELTVRESLEFSARLRSSDNCVMQCCGTSEARIKASVHQVLIDLKLDTISDTRLGEASGGRRGVSGGERKRVAIGMELIVNPPVLLLDEPTTGLDAASAIMVTSLLHSLVLKRRTVIVCTVHQPRADVFLQFGTVLMLRPLDDTHKKSIYYVGNPENAAEYLLSKGHALPNGMNVADLMLDVVASEFNQNNDLQQKDNERKENKEKKEKKEDKEKNNSEELFLRINKEQEKQQEQKEKTSHSYASPNRNNATMTTTDDDVSNTPTRGLGDTQITPLDENARIPTRGSHSLQLRTRTTPLSSSSSSSSSFMNKSKKCCLFSCPWETWILLRLECVRSIRAPASFLVHVAVATTMGILVGFLYQNMQPDIYGTWNRFLGIFAEVTMFALLGLSAVGTWQDGRIRFLRDRSSGYYGTVPYYLSKFLMDAVTLRIIPVVIFVLISYPIIGFEHQFNSTYVNTEHFINVSNCASGLVQQKGTCITDPLANTSDDKGAWGRSPALMILMLSMTAVTASTISSVVTAISTNGKVSNFATVLVILILIMFSGALVSNADLPWYVSWITWISPFAFSFEALTVGMFQDQCFLFNPTTMRSLFTPGKTGALACVEVPGYIWLLQFGCTPAGHDLNWTSGIPELEGLSQCNYTYGTIMKDIMASVVLLILYSLIALICFLCLKEKR